MKLLKTSKIIICGVLCSSLLAACDNSATTPSTTASAPASSSLALIHVKQGSLRPVDSSSLWGQMAKSFHLDVREDNPDVAKQIAYLQKHQDLLAKTLQEAGPYLSYVFNKTRTEGMPAELALLPVVESDYNPYAKSPVGASGLWQIMPGTATQLSLKTNQAYDGRRDIVASTDAALGYLDNLHRMFKNDWELALASYNWGPGNVQKAVKRKSLMGQASYWDIKMPKETQNYVPKLFALVAIIKNPAKYNIQLPKISAQTQVATVQVGPKVDLKQVAVASGIGVDTMRKLNPGYQKLATSQVSPNTILIPVDKVDAVKPVTLVLAVNVANSAVKVAPVQASIKAPVQQQVRDSLLKKGEWVLAALANIPSSSVFAAVK